ncbi:MAG: hypothetical protein JXB23_01545 [Candidatus Aminicenantes bacterium]|nr:hypothetical protein [Candidatus Aminicenantes bacterium]
MAGKIFFIMPSPCIFSSHIAYQIKERILVHTTGTGRGQTNRRLLKHSYLNVPFYKKRFDDHGLRPEDIKSFEDFAGDIKEIIVTDLWNYAWPLIRYRIGDLTSGEISHCPCGCTWRVVKQIEGRKSDNVTTPSGGLLHLAGFVARNFYQYLDFIDQFQFAKVAPNKIVLRLRLRKNHSPDLDHMKSSFEPFYRKIGMELDVVQVENFVFVKSGKHKMLIDETVDSDS